MATPFLFQTPNPLLQELPLWFLLGQRQSFLIGGQTSAVLPNLRYISTQAFRSTKCGLNESVGPTGELHFVLSEISGFSWAELLKCAIRVHGVT